jgi:sulfonate transport system permease protein
MSAVRFIAYRVWVPLALIVAWQALSRLGWISPLVLPSPLRVAEGFATLIGDGELLRHVIVSVVRVLEGFALAAVAGVAVGVAIGLWSFVDRSLDWLLQILRPIPPIGWFPLAILWFGIGEVSKVYIIFLGAFFPILVNVVEGIRQTEHRYVELARVFEVGWWRFLRQVVLPGALPSTLTGLRVGLGLAWTCVVAAELIAAEAGVGYLIVDARQTFRPDIVIVGMITIGLLGTGMDFLLRRLETRLVRWRQPFGQSTAK